MFYEVIGGGAVRCLLCAHGCIIGEGKRGICAVRENRGGRLYTLVYGKLVAMNVDPIEKKPLFHFLPGSRTLSIAAAGCNFRCEHCQNYEISQFPRERPDVEIPGARTTPETIVRMAIERGCRSISYTYTEPTIFLEFVLDCARLARENGIKNVFVSNGFMTAGSAAAAAACLDANNIDLKGGERFYRDVCHARAAPVKETIRLMREKGVWVEVTTLLIPGLNDSPETLGELARFISSVDPFIPWHVSRFHPAYKLLDRSPTPTAVVRAARETGLEAGLKHVYVGNIPDGTGEDTFCPSCGAKIISRNGYLVSGMMLDENGACPVCSGSVRGVWDSGGEQGPD